MTPSALKDFILQRYNAVGDTFFPEAEIYNYLWAAQMELANETDCIKNIYTTTSVANQRAYDFPTYTKSIARVEYDGERIFPNDFFDDDVLTGNNPDTTLSGRPANYQVFGSQIFLRPVPSTSGLTIKIYSYNYPTQPSATGTLDVPTNYQLMLVDYALSCMFSKDQNTSLAQFHLNLWREHKQVVLRTERQRMVGDSFRVVKDIDDTYNDSGYF